MNKKRGTLSDSVRQLIADCGVTPAELARLSKVDKGALSRFMSKERGLSTRSLDRLAAVCGWNIVGGPSGGKVAIELARKKAGRGG